MAVARVVLGDAAGCLPGAAEVKPGRSGLQPVWSVMALHRPAEFNKGHVPAFMSDEEPKNHLCVYPFVRSYEWYLLPRRNGGMLVEHGCWPGPIPTSSQHCLVIRPGRLRVDTGLRSRRAASHRRPDASLRAAAPAATPAKRCCSTPAVVATWPTSSPRGDAQLGQEAAGSRVSEMELMQ